MSAILYLIISIVLLLGCRHLNSENVSEKKKAPEKDTTLVSESISKNHPFFSKVYFSKEDAESILGENASLSDSSTAIKGDTFEIKSAYTANSKDQKTGKLGVVYFMIEKYKQAASAKNAYSAIKTANENHEGIKTLNDIGDEAYFHSDGTNFYFILVRKQDTMFRIKVNKITNYTSLDAFNLVAKKISKDL